LHYKDTMSAPSLHCPHPPRLLELTKWPNFPGFGFNLHAEKARQGQFIGKIDCGSPSEAAGMREGDRLVEVNGANVAMENHKQVVTRIRTSGSNCLLLLADRECDAWHREQGIVIRSDLPYTIISDSRQEEEEELDLRLQKLVMEEQEEVDSPVYLSRQESSTASDISTASESSTRSSNSLSPGPDQGRGGLQLNMSAGEMRARLRQQRRRDPRQTPEAERMDWWQRHKIVQSL